MRWFQSIILGTLATAFLGLLLAMTACNGKQNPIDVGSKVVVPPAEKSVFLRASFDDDPSSFMGRFIPDKLAPSEIDENQARASRCSKFITYKTINAGGSYDEYYNSAKAATATVGLPGIASGSASGGSNSTVRVTYDLKKKMVYTIEDQDAFDQCCAADSSQCDEFIVGEFLYGDGQVMEVAGSQASLEAGGIAQGITGEVSYKDQVGWRRSSKFESVYFAFRKQRVQSKVADTGDCGWATNVPSSLDGKYFVGMSTPVASRSQARDYAMRNARTQVVRYIGETITSSMKTKSTAVAGYLEDEQLVTAVAAGIASKVKDQKWCEPETTETPRGLMYSIRVLAFFPEADEKEARNLAVEKLSDALKADGKLDAGLKGELDQIKDK